jgi:hypothetical protein
MQYKNQRITGNKKPFEGEHGWILIAVSHRTGGIPAHALRGGQGVRSCSSRKCGPRHHIQVCDVGLLLGSFSANRPSTFLTLLEQTPACCHTVPINLPRNHTVRGATSDHRQSVLPGCLGLIIRPTHSIVDVPIALLFHFPE